VDIGLGWFLRKLRHGLDLQQLWQQHSDVDWDIMDRVVASACKLMYGIEQSMDDDVIWMFTSIRKPSVVAAEELQKSIVRLVLTAGILPSHMFLFPWYKKICEEHGIEPLDGMVFTPYSAVLDTEGNLIRDPRCQSRDHIYTAEKCKQMFLESRSGNGSGGGGGGDGCTGNGGSAEYSAPERASISKYTCEMILGTADDMWLMDESVGVRYDTGASAVAISRMIIPLPQLQNCVQIGEDSRHFLYYKSVGISSVRDEGFFGVQNVLKLIRDQLRSAISQVDETELSRMQFVKRVRKVYGFAVKLKKEKPCVVVVADFLCDSIIDDESYARNSDFWITWSEVCAEVKEFFDIKLFWFGDKAFSDANELGVADMYAATNNAAITIRKSGMYAVNIKKLWESRTFDDFLRRKVVRPDYDFRIYWDLDEAPLIDSFQSWVDYWTQVGLCDAFFNRPAFTCPKCKEKEQTAKHILTECAAELSEAMAVDSIVTASKQVLKLLSLHSIVRTRESMSTSAEIVGEATTMVEDERGVVHFDVRKRVVRIDPLGQHRDGGSDGDGFSQSSTDEAVFTRDDGLDQFMSDGVSSDESQDGGDSDDDGHNSGQ